MERLFPHDNLSCEEISPHDKKISTGTACDACDKYQVCPPPLLAGRALTKVGNSIKASRPLSKLHLTRKKPEWWSRMEAIKSAEGEVFQPDATIFLFQDELLFHWKTRFLSQLFIKKSDKFFAGKRKRKSIKADEFEKWFSNWSKMKRMGRKRKGGNLFVCN